VEFLPLIGIALLFWLLLIRPQTKRQRELREMQDSLSVGDEVLLTSGIHGVLREVGDGVVRVEIADGVIIRAARGAIGALVRQDNPSSDEVPDAGDEGNV
jgi:preprotein translocase subunit YajC